MQKSIIKQLDEFRDWMSTLRDVFSFDCEATSLNYLDLEIIGFSICDGRQACYVVLNPSNKEDILELLDYYMQESKVIVMHSAPFDMMVLHKEGIEI